MKLRFEPLTPERWPAIETLFGQRGGCAGCWCMWWRLTAKEFEAGKGEPNRRAFRALVQSGALPGIIAFDGERPVGWLAVEPRAHYPRLARARTLKPLDGEPVWSVSCFFVARNYRGQGVTTALLKAAAKHVRAKGGKLLEGYPVTPRSLGLADVFAWTGFLPAFEAAGFTVCARPTAARAIVRLHLR